MSPDRSLQGTTLFLGAGCSKAFGYPLTRDLLPGLLRQLKSGTLFSNFNGSKADSADRESLRAYLRELLPGAWAIPPNDLPNVTDLVSMVDHSLAMSYAMVRGRGGTDLEHFRRLLGMALFDLLSGREDRPPILSRFMSWLTELEEDGAVGIVTTNYDVTVDRELFALYETEDGIEEDRIAAEIDFGFDWRSPYTGRLHIRPQLPRFRYYKLHGSLNCLRCPLCDSVYINEATEIGTLAYAREKGDFNTCHCGHARLESNLVAPSFVRDVRDTNLLGVWKHALELLRTSPRWVIAGYSLPPEDVALRSLLVKACQGRDRRPGIEVVQKGSGNRSRFRLFFPECRYHAGGLEGFLARRRGSTRARSSRG